MIYRDLRHPTRPVRAKEPNRASTQAGKLSAIGGIVSFGKGSHSLSLQKLNYIYKESCGRSKEDDPSRRISLDEVARGGMLLITLGTGDG
jgi:hypothetical protein